VPGRHRWSRWAKKF